MSRFLLTHTIGSPLTVDLQTFMKEFGNMKQFYFHKEHYENYLCSKGKSCSMKKMGAAPPVPHGLRVFKGYKNTILRRDFVDFLINHPVAKDYEEFLSHTNVPDEHLYATLGRIDTVEEIFDTTTNSIEYKVTQLEPQTNYHVKDLYCQRISLWDHKNFYS